MNNNEERLQAIQPKLGMTIEVIYNEEFSVWEVSMEGTGMGVFETEEDASRAAENIHLAFETGYTNGLLLAYNDKPKAKKALEDRGIQFGVVLSTEDE